MNLKAAVFINKNKKNYQYNVRKIISRILECGADVMMLKSAYSDFMSCNVECFTDEEAMINEADIVIAAGGDGTIMRYAKLSARARKPIVGINVGRLGFISSLESNEIEKLAAIIKGNYFVDSRMLFDVWVQGDESKYLALNDVVISRDAVSQVIDYNVFRGNVKVCGFRSDGVIVSTPTGSTAYSMSAGGPIVDPEVECAIITPVCAHTLSSRPIILDYKDEIRIEYNVRDGSEAYVLCDGEKIRCSSGSGMVRIRKSDLRVDFVRPDKDRFYKNVREKLMG